MFIKKLESDNLAVSDNDFEIEPSSPFNNDKDKNLDLLVEEVPDKEMESIILDAMQEEIPNSLMVHPPTDLIKVDSEINISPLMANNNSNSGIMSSDDKNKFAYIDKMSNLNLSDEYKENLLKLLNMGFEDL